MPLKKGASRKTIGENIKEMTKAGHKPSQAAAAAYAMARKSPGFKDTQVRGQRAMRAEHMHKSSVIKDLGNK